MGTDGHTDGPDDPLRVTPPPAVPATAGEPATSPQAPIASIVIPAHDEETVVGRLLRALGPGVTSGRLDVVVACNGCRDATAAVARAHDARVVEVAEASKIAALNAGDAAARTFPRIYLDADLVVDGSTIDHLVAAVARPGVLCATPPMAVAVEGRPRTVRSFYAVWPHIPYVRDTHMGGVLAMAEEGRARFDRWPDVVADDLFARSLFARTERCVAGTEPYVVETPYTLRSLVRRRVRVHAGNARTTAHPALADLPGHRQSSGPWWQAVVERPRLAPHAVVYAAVNAAAKLAARRLVRRGATVGWGRDDTTRRATAPEPTALLSLLTSSSRTERRQNAPSREEPEP